MTDTITAAITLPVAPQRRIVTAVPGPKSLALHERRLAAVPVGVNSALPAYIARAHGA
ncbi:MAG: 4-aminobutyrate aminotransferase / (S)-3-amino-2-methylpropionate transaminase / 5-aminovalerate, partial [Actinomycetota bacterium]|nr:4-aminobutyrate aminotransferase / (S)-3-amino-2-methylpropionate transaminase / 5-aminovalerate [Actinomycetota bacterium]